MKKLRFFWKSASMVATAFPASGAVVSSASNAKVSPTGGAKVSPTGNAKVSPIGGAKVSLTGGAKVSPTGGAKVSPTGGAKVSPTGGAKVSPTSQQSSVIGARRPNFDKNDMNAIHKAARDDNHWRVQQIFFFNISDVNERDKKRRTALHVACAYGHPRMVKRLIKRPCLLNLCDIEEKTALIYAIQYKNTECANVLLDYGPDLNIKDNDGNTALHYAVLDGNTAIVHRLLARKANIEARNKSDLTPLALAKLANNDEMVKFLVARGAKDDQMKSKQQLTSEEKGPQKSESCTPVMEPQKTRKEAWTKTKPMIVMDVSEKDTLSSQQKITSKTKEKKGPQTSESCTPVMEPQTTRKEAWTKTKPMIVMDVSEKDTLSSQQNTTSKTKEKKGPQTSESCTPVMEPLKTRKEAWTKTKPMIVMDVSEKDSLSSQQKITSKTKEIKGPQTSESCTPVTDLRKTQEAWTKTKSMTEIVIDVSEEDSLSSKQPLTSTGKYKEERGPQKSEGCIAVREISEEESLSSKHRIAVSCPTSDNVVFKVEEGVEEKSSKRGVSENVHDGANDDSERSGLQQQIISEQTDSQQPNDTINENAAFLVDKVEEQQKKRSSKREVSGNMHDGAEDNSDSVGVRPKGNMEQSEKQQVPIKKNVNTDRTALHMDCGKGHRRVVRRIARRHCPLDLFDIDTKTALIYAIQNEQEEFAITLLDHGADPNVMDIHGNTPLHYAVLGQNTAIVEKLLSCMANVEVRNEDKFTPLSLAKYVNNEKMVEFLVTRVSKVHQTEGGGPQATEKETCLETNSRVHTTKKSVFKRLAIKSSKQQATSEKKEKRRLLKYSGINNLVTGLQKSLKQPWSKRKSKKVHEISEEEPSHRHGFPHWSCGLYSKRRIAVACPTSDNVVFKVEEEEEEKSSKREVSRGMYDGTDDDSDDDGLSQHSNREQTDNQQPKDDINEDAVILMNTIEEQEKMTSSKREVSGNMHDGAEDNSESVGVRPKGNMEQSEKQQVPIKEKENSHRHGFPHWSCGLYSKRRIAVACPTSDNVVFKVEEKNKQINSKREVSENMYNGANDDNDRSGLRQQINSEQTDSQLPNDKINENTAFLVDKVKEKKKPKSRKREESANMYDGAGGDSNNDGLSQHSNREQTDNQQPNDTINENAVILMNKVEEQEKKTSSKREVSGNMHDGAEDNSDSVGVRKKGNMEQSEKKQVPIKENVNTDRHGFPHWSCGLYSKRRIAVACPTSDNVVFKVEGETKQRSSIKEVSGNISDGADDDSDRNGLRHQGNSQETDTQQSNEKINENTVYLMNKVEEKKEQKNSKREESGNMCDGANDDTDRAGGRQISKSEQSDKHQFPIVENDDSERLISQEEEEKRQKADLLSKKNTGQTRKKEKQSIKNVEMSPKVENTTRTQVMALKTVRRNKVSDSDEKEQRLLRENRRLKNKIAKLTLELDTVKNQNPEMDGKNDSVDIVTVKEKIDHLQKTITETLFLQPNAQLEVLRAELTMLSSKLEDEQQNRRRLEAEGDSHRSRRATVVQDHEHCQTSKGDLQVDFKKEKEELICSQDKNKSDMSNLKRDIMEIFSQKFSILKNKVNRLEIELHHTRVALRERAVVLEDGERDQSQTQCQKKEIENVSQKEQGKVNADIGKQESLQERLSHLQRENKLLQQQLERAHYKSEKKGETVIRIQDQIVDTIKMLPANSKKQGLRLNETCEELIHECHLLKESRLQYENDKAESDGVVRQLQGELADTQRKLRQLQGELVDTQRKLRQLQGELADTQRKLSMTEASLKVETHHCMCSQYQIQELQKELDESRSQCQRQKEESKKCIDLNIFLQQRLHEEMKKKSDLQKPMARFQEPLNISKRNLNKEQSFDRDLNPSLIEMKMKTDRLIQETEEFIAASTCNHSPEDNTDQLEEEMKELQKKCDQMTSRRASWKQEIIRVQRQREINRAKHLQELQRLDKIGECARPDIEYRREQVRQFYQDFFPL